MTTDSNIIHKGVDFSLYLDKDEESDIPLVVKQQSKEQRSPSLTYELKNEWELTNELSIPGVRKARKLDTSNGQSKLFLDYVDGTSMHEFFVNRDWDLMELLDFAIKLSKTLNSVHSVGIIHKDINSRNILVEKNALDPVIIDFGIATRLNLKSDYSISPKRLEGSLSFISPEQTGRMNRLVDFRSDLYSLGITLFELFTGELPFEAAGAAELVYCHIAKNPLPPHSIKPEIPKIVSKIILKLLEKNSENRYQTALGLKHDLEKVRQKLIEGNESVKFSLAKHDFSNRFQIPQKLYGRENEVSELLSLFDSIRKGNSTSTFITGFSGVGKSSLVHEIYRPISEYHGLFIEGKFEQYQRNIPYQAITSALKNLVQLLLGESDERLSEWKHLILKSTGGNAGVLTALVPELEVVIGRQDVPPTVGPIESQNRFNFTFSQFIRGIASEDRPLVLFLDDLQSADQASLQLIRNLLTDKSVTHFYFIGSYRENEVDLQHPLQLVLDDIKSDRGNLHIMQLKGLSQLSLTQLLSETLNVEENKCIGLSSVVNKKTDSNPYFILEFLKSLHESELISWDEKKLRWKWDEQEISNSAATENVIQFLTRKINSYSKPTLGLMKIASCIGNTFSFDVLQNVSGESLPTVLKHVQKMIGQGYLLPVGSNEIYLEEDQVFAAFSSYKFVHDRFQQAVYSLIDDEERIRIHLNIGKYLQELKISANNKGEAFEIVNHFNEAKDLLQDAKDQRFLCELNYESGLKAKDSSAWDAANKHFQIAQKLLPKNHWEEHYSFSFHLMLELAQAEFLIGNVDESERLMDLVLKYARTQYDKALVISQRIVLKGVQGDYDSAIALSRKCLGLLNVKMPSSKGGIRVAILNGLIKASLKFRNKTPDYILSLPKNESKEGALVLKVLSDSTFSAYYVNREYYLLLQLVATNYSLKYGNTEYSGFPYANYAIIQLALFRKYRYAYEFCDVVMKLNDKYPNQLVRGRILSPIKSGILHWNIPLSELKPYYDEGITISMQSGDQWYASSAQLNFFALQLKQGKNLNLIQMELVEFQSYFDNQDNAFHQSEYRLYRLFIDLMSDSDVDQSELENFIKSFERDNEKNEFLLAYLYTFVLRYYVLNGITDTTGKIRSKLNKVISQMAASPWEADGHFYLALSKADDQSTEPSKRASIVRKKLKFFNALEENCPQNFSCFTTLLRAEINRLENNVAESLDNYNLAASQAKENQFIHIEALANERAGLLSLKNRFKYEGQKYFQRALLLYANWGAKAKAEKLKRDFPEIEVIESTHRIARSLGLESTSSSTVSFFNDSLDLNTIMKASTALADEVRFEGLLDILMNITKENAGAERVILVLDKDEHSMPKGMLSRQDSDIKLFFGVPDNENEELPVSLIKYVSRTNEELVLDDATVDFRFAQDLYFKDQLPYSILCLPIHYQGTPIGVIYLENSLTSGVFSDERLNLIKLLSGQIAVSIENSLLYENLEEKVNERTKELTEEKKKSDDLLLNILPEEVADELKETGKSVAKQFDNVSVLFTDFKSFIKTAESFTAQQLVEELNICFEAFDNIVSKLGMDKIKTIGDAYMAAGGLQEQGKFKPKDLVNAGLEMQKFMLERKESRQEKNLPAFDMRVGIHSGPVVAGIVGVKKFQYDIWGDTVNTASRMESSGEIGKVNISQVTYELIKDDPQFAFEFRGKIDAKGKGKMDMWFVSEA